MSQKFGSDWTKIKLDILEKYSGAFSVALRKKFKLCYVDAFAGSGEIELKSAEERKPEKTIFGEAVQNTEKVIAGSAMRAIEKNFDSYYFFENNPGYVEGLQKRIKSHPLYTEKKDKIHVFQADSNEPLQKITSKDWRRDGWRGLMFFDPYSMEVEWETLEEVAKTGAFDVWYLFPLSALLRCLPNKKIPESPVINKILGTDEWSKILYSQNSSKQGSLFGETETEIIRKQYKSVGEYVVKRLKTIFPYVHDEPLVLHSQNKAPLFMFIFACSNQNEKAIAVASKIAKSIVKQYNSSEE